MLEKKIASNSTSSAAAVEFRNISKKFGGLVANNKVSFSIQRGQIHALIGENGAGKSTLCKILFGIYQADEGQILINGKPIQITNPMIAKQLKLGMVHQHFHLADPITALDHVILDMQNLSADAKSGSGSKSSLGHADMNIFSWIANLLLPIPRNSILKKLEKLSEDYGMPVPWQTPVGKIPVGLQQRLEIIKLLFNQADILILDEPTAVLTPQEVESFFEQLRKLKDAGKTIIIITHKLKEVMALSDTITVFRQGQHIKTMPTHTTNMDELAELMVGKKWSPTQAVRERQAAGTTLLSFRNYSLADGKKKILDNINFNMRPNEIVGIAGIEGNGQNEFVESIVSPLKFKGRRWGHIELREHSLLQMTSHQIKMLGISYLPPDRTTQGLLLDSNSYDNFILGYHRTDEFQARGFLNFAAITERIKKAFETYDIRPKNPLLPLKNFSGGNQQKLIIARELMELPDLLVACQPTRGVDIGAIDRIHQEFFRLKREGASVLVVSSDLDELFRICDRIVVMYDGKIVGQYFYYEFDEQKIGALMGGASV